MWFRSGSEINVQYLRINNILYENGQIFFLVVLGQGYPRQSFEISDLNWVVTRARSDDWFRLDFSRISTNQHINFRRFSPANPA